ncbi:MAG: serine hydrolase domain-containing protein [Terriglobales bacterium]
MRAATCLAAALLTAAALGSAAAQSSLPEAQQAAINTVFQDFNQRTPGCALGVVRAGALVFAHGYGMASLESHTAVTPATVMEIGSVSKQFTATSIFLLAHAGKLSLDDPIRKYIPEMPRYPWPVTIRELLHHTSGVRDVISLMETSGIPYGDFATMPDALAMIERQRGLNFPPNSAYMYSNSGYVLLAEIVRRVSGEPLPKFAASNIFQPLGMGHTQIVDDATLIVPGRARTYARTPTGYRLADSHWEQIGDGAVNTTVGDMALWARNMLHPTVGGPWLIRDLTTQGVLNNGQQIAYAGGLEVDHYRGLERWAHAGSWQGFRAEFMRFPGQQLSLVTLCDGASTNPGPRTEKLADILLAGELAPAAAAPAAVALSAAQLAGYAGLYWSAARHDLRRAQIRDGRLRLGRAPLTPVGAGRFLMGTTTVEFQPATGGMRLVLAPGEQLRRVPQATPAAVQLAALTGRYHSIELQVSWTVSVQSGQLELHALGANPNRLDTDHDYAMTPGPAGVYSAGPYLLQFEGSSFRLYNGRAGGMLFTRAAP